VISVAIPTLDAGPGFEVVLAAIARQEVEEAVEVVVLDSASRDGTRELAARQGAAVHRIERADFGHGRSRNRLMELSRGDVVAFLTQDAEPADEHWLRRLAAGVRQAEDVALACGPYRAQPGASVMVRRELEAWFASVDAAGPLVRAADLLDPPPVGPATFASSANLALRRDAWERTPFRDVAYAEDQQLVLDQLAAGRARAWVRDAVVVHSHDYAPGERFRRWFDEFRALHEVYGFQAPRRPDHVLGRVRREVALDRRAGAGVAESAAYHLQRATAAALGTRAGALPEGVRRRLSRDGRA
jgi:rhamnosyltransferase